MSELNKKDHPSALMNENNYAYYPQLDAQGKPLGLTLMVHVEATDKGYFVNRELMSEQDSKAVQQRFQKAGGEPVQVSLSEVMEYAEGHGLNFVAKTMNEKGQVESHVRPFDEDYAERSAEEMVFVSDPVRQVSKGKEGLPVFSAVTYEIENGQLRVAEKVESTIVYDKNTRAFDVEVSSLNKPQKKEFDMDNLTLENSFEERDRIEMQQIEASQKKEDFTALAKDEETKMRLGAKMNKALEDELDLQPGEQLTTRVYDPEFVDQVTYQQMEKERNQSLTKEETFGEILLGAEKQKGHREDDDLSR